MVSIFMASQYGIFFKYKNIINLFSYIEKIILENDFLISKIILDNIFGTFAIV